LLVIFDSLESAMLDVLVGLFPTSYRPLVWPPQRAHEPTYYSDAYIPPLGAMSFVAF